MSYNLEGRIARTTPYALDTTLTVEGAAAEAKATGEAINAAKTEQNTHANNTSNPHSVTKAQVGLSEVDNTADLDKPVSTLQAQAIADAKREAMDTATEAMTVAATVGVTAEAAKIDAQTAQTTAGEAKTAAETAQTTASEAKTVAETAQTSADEAKTAIENGVRLNSDGKVLAGQIMSTKKNITATSYTIVAEDAGKMLFVENASTVTITVPAGLAVETELEIVRYGDGAVNLQTDGTSELAASGAGKGTAVTVTIPDIYGVVALKQVDTNVWLVAGEYE